MTFARFALASTLLAFAPLAVISFDTISFSAVQQCGNFTVQFSGDSLPASLPLSLTVIPFNLTPISIAIQNPGWDNRTLTGAVVTFLPYPVGTLFLASLDDADGSSTGPVSGIMKIGDSAVTSCLSDTFSVPKEEYTLVTSPSQCEEFAVTYDTTILDSAPAVRVFQPSGNSSLADLEAIAPGKATYTIDAARGQQVVLTFSNDTTLQQATGLITVGGDAQSPTNCLNPASVVETTAAATSDEGGLSMGAIIGIAVACIVIVVVVAITMAIWLRRERQRAKATFAIPKDPENYAYEKPLPLGPDGQTHYVQHGAQYSLDSIPPAPPPKGYGDVPQLRVEHDGANNVKNPLYTTAVFDVVSPRPQSYSPSVSLTPDPTGRAPLSSIPVPLVSPMSFGNPLSSDRASSQRVSIMTGASTRSRSLCSDDIEHILDMATLYSGPASPISASALRSTPTVPPLRTVMEDESYATRRPDSAMRGSPIALTIQTPASSPHTPLSASSRDPPQAPLPTSPVPTPSTAHFSRMSEDQRLDRPPSRGSNLQWTEQR